MTQFKIYIFLKISEMPAQAKPDLNQIFHHFRPTNKKKQDYKNTKLLLCGSRQGRPLGAVGGRYSWKITCRYI